MFIASRDFCRLFAAVRLAYHDLMPGSRYKFLSIAFRSAVVALIIGAAILIVVVLTTTRPEPEPSDAASTALRVQVMPAAAYPVQRQWEGFGTARAIVAADVPARVTATVANRPEEMRPGRAVAKGDLIMELDSSDFERQVEIASQSIEDINAQLQRLSVEEQAWSRRAELSHQDVELARADFERVQQAFAQDAARQRELDVARQALIAAERSEIATREEFDKIGPRRGSLRAQLQSQEATLRIATVNVERSRITSPIDGVLQAVDVEEGESVTAGQRVARVVGLERIEVPLLMPSSARPHISIGDEVELQSAGEPPLIWHAPITRLAPADEEATRTLRAYVEVTQDPQERGLLPPGKFVQATVRAGRAEPRWIVPRRAVNAGRLMLVENDVIRSLTAEVEFHVSGAIPATGLRDTEWLVLTDPLPEGSMIVIDGARALPEGGRVIPVTPYTMGTEIARDGEGAARPGSKDTP